MTFWDLVILCRRFWVVSLVGLALTTLVAYGVAGREGTYNGQVKVILLAPQPSRGNALVEPNDSLIDFAGVLGRVTGGPGGASRSVSDDVTLVGEGVRTGYSIQQPNSGGQWEYRFNEPTLNVQSAGETLEETQRQMSIALTTIQDALDDLQVKSGVAANMRISMQLSPSAPVYSYEHGSRTRAVAATVLLGIAITVSAVVATSRLWTARRTRSPKSSKTPTLVTT